MTLEELREELKRQRSQVMMALQEQKVLVQSDVYRLAMLQTAIEAVSAVLASGGPEPNHSFHEHSSTH